MSAQRGNAGPVNYADYKIAERLDRPIMRTFQRHPGNQVPEAQIVAKVSATSRFALTLADCFRPLLNCSVLPSKPDSS